LASLPGGDLIARGVGELARGEETVASLLVSIGAPRLRRAGVALPPPFSRPEHRLYLLLERTEGNAAHGRYNALLRGLVSFERAAECGG
jgi:hypothetical protein